MLSLCIISCRSTNENIADNNGAAAVKINIKGNNFDDNGSLIPQASIGNIGVASGLVQRQEIVFNNNDDYKLVATLTPITTATNTLQASSKSNTIAATEVNPLGIGVKYKVLIFDSNGNYVKEQDYSSGQADPVITNLNGGSTYTFVVYSIGSKTDLPAVTYSDTNAKTLANASLQNISGDSDLMYFSKSMTVSGNTTNYLDITLRHKFTQIITTLDASPTNGYSITNINGVTISPHTESATMQLSNGNTTVSGASLTRSILFPTVGTKTIVSDPVFINSEDVTNGVFAIKSVTMDTGGALNATVTHENVTFNKLKITRGFKYELKLSFTPNDRYMTYKGYPAVRLNGFIWMRHNLGANTSLDPDDPKQSLIGNYYQWGTNNSIADGYTSPNPIPGWDQTVNPPSNSWNSGTASTPIKTSNDPCPSGWRIPSQNEFSVLLNNTDQSNVGTWTQNQEVNNFSAAKLFKSKFVNSIILTLPTAGVRNTDENGALWYRGVVGAYWTSNSTGTANTAVNFDSKESAVRYYSNLKSNAFSVRCIADSPIN
ncbi:hypothetical protein HZQ32_17055 [Elizabethkingia anophelis]|nr:hypothetical protein [Elizabethkingia anophelis]